MMAEASPLPTEIPTTRCMPEDSSLSSLSFHESNSETSCCCCCRSLFRNRREDFPLEEVRSARMAIDESESDVELGTHTHTAGITREEEAQSVEGEFGLS